MDLEVSIETVLSKLVFALRASGHTVEESDCYFVPLATKLVLLHQTGRFSKLLSKLFAANDKSNLQSLVLEASFAYAFEAGGRPLDYEVRCRSDSEMTVDFCMRIASGKNLYLEMRLVRQRKVLTDLFEEQLRHSVYFGAILGGVEDRADTLRLQRLILSKAQDPAGNPMKFTRRGPDDYNIIVGEVSELHLGMIDRDDCLLVTHGDAGVPEFARRQIFGLFQADQEHYPEFIHELAAQFSSFRDTVHGVLFLRKCPSASPFNFELEFFLVPNQNLITTDSAMKIAGILKDVMRPWTSNDKRG